MGAAMWLLIQKMIRQNHARSDKAKQRRKAHRDEDSTACASNE
jgi:hypothetical protein